MSTSLELLPAGEARETGTAARIAAAASKEVTVPVTLLGNYLWTLAAVAETGRRLTRSELDACRQRGVDAATGGVGLRALVDLHLTATWRAWEELPAAQTATRLSVLRAVARSVLRAADDAVAALADGYEHAQRLAIRQEEAMRREFIDDLLGGGGDLELLVARAERFGLRLASHHVVAVATAGPNQLPLTEASSLTRRAEAEIAHRFSSRDVLVATKSGLLVCVVPAVAGVVDELSGMLHRLAGLRVGVGRPHAGPLGVAHSYEEARDALDLATRLGLEDPVVEAAGLLMYRMLLRNPGAITELVEDVLGPLHRARGGPGPLLDTLTTYFATGGVAAETARRIPIGVRTVTYRLERIRALTGYAATDPAHRFTLEAAVLGARLLDWPTRPLEPIPQLGHRPAHPGQVGRSTG